MVGKLITRVFFTSVLWLFVSAAQAMDVASIQVSSSGSVEVLPDYITIDVSIEKTDMDRAVAKKQADEITQQVLDATLALGVKDEHIDASRLFIYPQYRWNEQTRVLLGQRAVRTVQIKLYDLERYSEFADKLVNIDISSMNQRGAGFDDLESHRNDAIVDALKNAQTNEYSI